MGDFRERALGEDYELVYSDMVISLQSFVAQHIIRMFN
jgi:hypothetical protein